MIQRRNRFATSALSAGRRRLVALLVSLLGLHTWSRSLRAWGLQDFVGSTAPTMRMRELKLKWLGRGDASRDYSNGDLTEDTRLLKGQVATLAQEIALLTKALKGRPERFFGAASKKNGNVAEASEPKQALPKQALPPLPPLPPVTPLPPPPPATSSVLKKQVTPSQAVAVAAAQPEASTPQAAAQAPQSAPAPAPQAAPSSPSLEAIGYRDVLEEMGDQSGHRDPEVLRMLKAVQDRVKDRRKAGELPIG